MMFRRTAAALLAATFVSPALASPESEAMLRAFISGIDASPDWTASVNLVRSEGNATVGEGLVFSRREPDVSVSVERLTLNDLGARNGGGFAASSITLDGGSVVSELVDYAIPTATVSDVSAPDMAGVTFDPRKLMTSFAQLYSAVAEAEFASFRIPEATSTQRQVLSADAGGKTLTTRAVYRNLDSTALRGGILERTSAGPVTIAVEAPDAGETKVEIASLFAERTDLGAFSHIFDAARFQEGRGDGVWRPVMSRLGYSGLSGAGPDGTSFRLREAVVENVDGRQPEEPPTPIWDRLLDPATPEDARSELALDAVRKMYSAWRVGTVRMDTMAVEADQPQSEFSLGGLTLSGLSSDGIDSFILQSLRGKGPNGFASLAAFELSGLVFPDIDALTAFAALENEVAPEKHEATLRSTFAGLPRLAHLGFRSLAAGKSETEAVLLDSFTLDFRDWNDIYAQSTDLRVEGLTVPRALMQLDPKAAEIVDGLGYDRFVFGMSFADRWSPEAGTDEGRWAVTMQDAADAELSYTLSGVTVDWVLRATAAAGDTADSQAALMTMLNELGLKRATLKLTDRSLLDRGFGVAAKKQNLTVEGPVYREQLRGALPFLLSAAVPAAIAKLLTAPLQGFMAGGQALVAEIAPPAPIPLAEIVAGAADPMALPERLGVTVRSEPPPN